MGHAAAAATLRPPKWLSQRVRIWERRLGLDSIWSVTIEFKSKLKGAKAQITWAQGYQTATLEVSQLEYEKMSETEVDVLLCHELYHLTTARCHDALEEAVGRDTIVYNLWAKEEERCADQFAILLTRIYRRKRE